VASTFSLWRRVKLHMQLRLTPARLKPVVGRDPWIGPQTSPATLVVVCSVGFNIDVPNAAATFRIGLSRGFAALGIRSRLASVFELSSALQEVARPFVLLSVYDYAYLDRTARRLLKDVPHFVWVNPSFPRLDDVYRRYDLPDPRPPRWIRRRVRESRPRFVFAPVPPSALQFYEDWARDGHRVESVLQACDAARYTPGPTDARFEGIRIAYVGGYWPYKSRQYEKYLRPYESSLTVYGYDAWPYSGYAGRLAEGDEAPLYRTACLCPALSEPHAEVMGDIVERVYKILGCGGVAVTDVVPFYREVFTADELLVPRSIDEYHNMVADVLRNPSVADAYRQRGVQAIHERHTYAHRAAQILRLLDFDGYD
jgi:hypothetical protein